MDNDKSIPLFTNNKTYTKWREEILHWRKTTKIEKHKQAIAILSTVKETARHSLNNIDYEKFKNNNGIDVLIKEFDHLFFKFENDNCDKNRNILTICNDLKSFNMTNATSEDTLKDLELFNKMNEQKKVSSSYHPLYKSKMNLSTASVRYLTKKTKGLKPKKKRSTLDKELLQLSLDIMDARWKRVSSRCPSDKPQRDREERSSGTLTKIIYQEKKNKSRTACTELQNRAKKQRTEKEDPQCKVHEKVCIKF